MRARMSQPSVLRPTSELYELEVLGLGPADRSRLVLPACPVCNASEAYRRLEMKERSQWVAVCSRCGLGRLHPLPDAESLRGYYPDSYYGEPGVKFQALVEGLVRSVGARHAAFLTAGIPEGARVLDVGCGRGVLLAAIADRGFEAHGVEISEQAAAGVEAWASIRIAPTVDAAGYPDAYFDQVIIWHVLEHLPDPRGTLATVHRILKPGGRLVVAVPNFSSLQARLTGAAWFHLDLPRHLYHFPLAGLRRLLEGCGFEVGAAHHFSLRQNPFGWIQSLMNKLPFLPRNGLYVLLHRQGSRTEKPYTAQVRACLWLCLVLGIPLGVFLSLAETAMRSGATVHVVSHRPLEGDSSQRDESLR